MNSYMPAIDNRTILQVPPPMRNTLHPKDWLLGYLRSFCLQAAVKGQMTKTT